MRTGELFPRVGSDLAACLFLKLANRDHLGGLNNFETKKPRLDKMLLVLGWHKGGHCCQLCCV